MAQTKSPAALFLQSFAYFILIAFICIQSSLAAESRGYCDSEEGLLVENCREIGKRRSQARLDASAAKIQMFAGDQCVSLASHDNCLGLAMSPSTAMACQQPCGTDKRICDNPASGICSRNEGNPNLKNILAAEEAEDKYYELRAGVFTELKQKYSNTSNPCSNLNDAREKLCKADYNRLMNEAIYGGTEGLVRKQKVEAMWSQAKNAFVSYLQSRGAPRTIITRIQNLKLSFNGSETQLFQFSAAAQIRSGDRFVNAGGMGLYADKLPDSLFQILLHEAAHHGDASSFSANTGGHSAMGPAATNCMKSNMDAGDNKDIVTEAMADAASMDVLTHFLSGRLRNPPALNSGSYEGNFFDRRTNNTSTNRALYNHMAKVLAPKCLYDDGQVLDGRAKSKARRVEYASGTPATEHPHFEDRINRVFMAHPQIRYELNCENYYGNVVCQAIDGSCGDRVPGSFSQPTYYGIHCAAVDTEGGTLLMVNGSGGPTTPGTTDLPTVRTERGAGTKHIQ